MTKENKSICVGLFIRKSSNDRFFAAIFSFLGNQGQFIKFMKISSLFLLENLRFYGIKDYFVIAIQATKKHQKKDVR